jgi:aryl carrier-like protein
MSERMVRKQIYLEPRQDRLLKARARQLGVTEAELIRQGLDQVLDAPAVPPEPRLEAWEELMRFFRRRLRMDVPQTGRTWSRGDLYDRPRPH